MENADQAPNVRVSNWTLATGTRPGERQVFPAAPRDPSAPAPDARR